MHAAARDAYNLERRTIHPVQLRERGLQLVPTLGFERQRAWSTFIATVTANDPTPDELLAALSQPDALYEVVEGKIVEATGMGLYAGRIALRLMDAIEDRVRPCRLGFALIETLVILDVVRNTRRRPDVAYISAERWPLDRAMSTDGDPEVVPDLVPDLVIEVVSPNDRVGAIAKKIREFFRYKVRQVWVVQPETREISIYLSPKKIEVFEDGDDLTADDLLPGLKIPLAALFSTTID
jgi:Uma2 family endonuclease